MKRNSLSWHGLQTADSRTLLHDDGSDDESTTSFCVEKVEMKREQVRTSMSNIEHVAPTQFIEAMSQALKASSQHSSTSKKAHKSSKARRKARPSSFSTFRSTTTSVDADSLDSASKSEHGLFRSKSSNFDLPLSASSHERSAARNMFEHILNRPQAHERLLSQTFAEDDHSESSLNFDEIKGSPTTARPLSMLSKAEQPIQHETNAEQPKALQENKAPKGEGKKTKKVSSSRRPTLIDMVKKGDDNIVLVEAQKFSQAFLQLNISTTPAA